MAKMTKQEADAWVAQELSKLTTIELLEKHLQSYQKSQEFFNSPAGIASGNKDPLAREARHVLASLVRAKLND